MSPHEPLLQIDLPGVPKVKSGKVREVFDLGDAFLFVASDRISAFDVIMPNGIPRKGEVLTQISHFWFDRTESLVPNHRLARADDPLLNARYVRQLIDEHRAGRDHTARLWRILAFQVWRRDVLETASQPAVALSR